MTATRRLLPFLLVTLGLVSLLLQPAMPGSAAPLTPTPTIAPTPTPNLPQSEIGSYRLKSWKKGDAIAILKSISQQQEVLEKMEYPEQAANSPFSPQDLNRVAMTLIDEILLRFSKDIDPADLQKQLLNRKLSTFQDPESLEMLRARIEEAMNRDPLVFSNLGDWLEKNYPKIRLFYDPIEGAFLGSGSTSWLVHLDHQMLEAALLVIQLDPPNHFHVYPVTPDWEQTFHDNWMITTDDLNGNGQADVAIQHLLTGMGMSHYCSQYLDVYEWNGQGFVELANHLGSVTTDSDMGDCLGWKYITENGKSPVIASEQSAGISHDPTKDFVTRQLFTWDGARFIWAGSEDEPFQKTNDPVAAANWAYEAGPQNDQAFDLLKKTIQEWPKDLEKDWGPAAEDFFHYKLGLWYAFRGDASHAIEILNQVRDHPSHPEYTTASRIADAFLHEYPSRDSFVGCSRVINTLWAEYQSYKNPSYGGIIGNFEYDLLLSKWGFQNWYWNAYDSPFFPVLGRGQETTLCSLAEAFHSSLARSPIHSEGELRSWLSRNQVPWNGLYSVDLNRDGLTDWLVMLSTSDPSERDLWALIQQSSGVLAIKIENLYDGPNSLTAFRTFQPAKEAATYFAYQVNQNVLVFHLDQTNGEIDVNIDFTSQPGWPEPNVEVNARLIDVRGQVPDQQLVILGINRIHGIISWDSNKHQLKGTRTLPTKAVQIKQVEKALFVDQKPDRAQAIIQSLFQKANSEYFYEERLDDSDRPYLQYLLGLTYELRGDTQSAVKAYYLLWHDYPDDSYAILAREKLERKP